MKFLKNTRAAVFITVMLISMMMIIVGVAASNLLMQDAHMIRHLKESTQAQYIAEGGISRTLTSMATSGFSYTAYDSSNNSLGSGEYDIDVIKWVVDPNDPAKDRWLITSVGRAGSASRTATMEVKDLSSGALNYALAAGTNIYLKATNGMITVKGDIHANNFLTLHENGDDIRVEAYGPLNGKATCTSNKSNAYTLKPSATAIYINDRGNSGSNKPRLNMPTFDFGTFKAIAQATGEYYTGNQPFNNNPNIGASAGNTAGITYVDGDATFTGTCQITGGFVAKGDITLNNNNTLTQVAHFTNAYPIFMSEAGTRIRLYGVFTSTGGNIVYATNNVQIETPGGTSTILGTVIAGGSFFITANNDLSLTYQNITAPGVQPIAIEIVSWNR
jgi:hypothetical protein